MEHQKFLKNTLSAGVTAGYNLITQDEIKGNNLLTYNANLSYRFFKNHILSVFGYSNNYTSAIATAPSYTDYTFRVQYQYLFSKSQ